MWPNSGQWDVNGCLLGDFGEGFICSYKQMLKEMVSSTSGCWHIWIQHLEIMQTSWNLQERELRMNPINQKWHGRPSWKTTVPWWYTWTAEVIFEESHLRILCFRRLVLKQFDPGTSDTFNQIIITNIGEFYLPFHNFLDYNFNFIFSLAPRIIKTKVLNL